ncbi:MAG: radical SAM protein [bacterium]|nr:radical SAM protein [bacterium]
METVDLRKVFTGLTGERKFRKYRELWKKAEALTCLTSFPLHLDVELSGVCNLNCEFCFQNGLIDEPLGLMDYSLFQRILDEGAEKGLCAVKLQIRGESFLHPELFRCIAYAKEKGIVDVQITTNGTLLDRSKMRELMSSDLDSIIFSVDLHHRDSMESGQYSQPVREVVTEFLELRKELGKKRPWVRVRGSISENSPGAFRQMKRDLKSTFPLADIFIVGRIHDFHDDGDSFPDLHRNYHLNSCSYLLQRLAVFWNGDTSTCCMDYNNRFKLGNISECSIESIWLSEKMRDFRKRHSLSERNIMPICKHCHVCITAKDEGAVLDETSRHIADYPGDSN